MTANQVGKATCSMDLCVHMKQKLAAKGLNNHLMTDVVWTGILSDVPSNRTLAQKERLTFIYFKLGFPRNLPTRIAISSQTSEAFWRYAGNILIYKEKQ